MFLSGKVFTRLYHLRDLDATLGNETETENEHLQNKKIKTYAPNSRK